ncbi:MAG: HD domain-containing protein [Acidobacteria bacterium]|nr:HD domain-containing protein [Acidobacteriota bacterium]
MFDSDHAPRSVSSTGSPWPHAGCARPRPFRPLHVLLIPGDARDDALLARELAAGGYATSLSAVDSPSALHARLERRAWDLLIADLVPEGFGALAALEIIQASHIDLPVLVVAGARGEDRAVHAMRAGASDYLARNRLVTIGPIVDRILKESAERRTRQEAERAAREREQQALLELATAYDATVEGWSRALDLRDHETEGHSRRVAEVTVKLARRMGVSEIDLVHIRRGALLHDIGKIGVPDAVLLKPAALTPAEWIIMRRHPELARELLAPIEYLRPALDIPYCHHEKWDGTGYPRGLQGTEIPLAARIFAAADIWDAIRSDRPYRKGWSTEAGRVHMMTLSGTHLDPAVVAAFLDLLAEDDSVGR